MDASQNPPPHNAAPTDAKPHASDLTATSDVEAQNSALLPEETAKVVTMEAPTIFESAPEEETVVVTDANVPTDEPIPHSVPLPVPLAKRISNTVAFGLSAALSPYLVLPFGTVGIIGSITQPRRTFLLYTAISVFFSTILPALYVVNEVRRGKITDVHIMDRAQRGGPFMVAIGSSALGALVLRWVGAPMDVWGISAVLAFNGMVLTWITSFWKISMHVAVLSATVAAAVMMIPQVTVAPLVALVPILIWARVSRGRHTLWQGLAGATLSALITALTLTGLRAFYNPAMRQSIMNSLGL